MVFKYISPDLLTLFSLIWFICFCHVKICRIEWKYTEKKKQQRRRAGRHPPMRKKKPPKPKTCMTLMELARAFPNIAQQLCFHPKQSTFNSVVGRVPRSKQKVATWL